MKLPVVALFERSLRLEMRSALMAWSRAGFLLLILFLLFQIHMIARSGFYAAPGLNFLEEMTWVNFLFITLAGLSYFASAITEEKEEMMLGLLRMTDLNPVAILLGKSTSRFVGAVLLLLVQVPFVLLAVTLGGVGLLQIAAAYGTLLAYLFLVCNLALLFSVVFRTTSIAAAWTLSGLLLFLIAHYWAASIVKDVADYYGANPQRGAWSLLTTAFELWGQATPTARLSEIFRTGFTGPAIGFQIVSNLALGVLFFLLSWLVFDRFTREEKEPSPARGWLPRRTSRQGSRIPAGAIGLAAVTWKDFNFISGGKFGLWMKFGLMIFLIGLCNFMVWEFDNRNLNRNVFTREFEGGVLIWISLLLTAICLALDAARVFQEEIRWKTLSSLVTLPATVGQLAYRKVAGVLLHTLPLLSGFVLGVCLIPDTVMNFFLEMFSEWVGFGFFIVAILQFVMFLHLTAFLSLLIKRGALALAVAIQYVGGSFMMGFASMIFAFSGGGRSSAGLLCFLSGTVCVVATVILHKAIGTRLARAAAEE